MDRSSRLLALNDKENIEVDLVWPADFVGSLHRSVNKDNVLEKMHDSVFMELLLTFPLLRAWTFVTKEVYLLGKIKKVDYPYDVILLPLQGIEVKKDKLFIHDYLLLQVKMLPPKMMGSVDELKEAIEESIRKASRTQPGISGALYIIAFASFSIRVSSKQIDEVLETISIPPQLSFQRTIFAMQVVSGGNNVTSVWLLHPEFNSFPFIREAEMVEVTKIYEGAGGQYAKIIFPELFESKNISEFEQRSRDLTELVEKNKLNNGITLPGLNSFFERKKRNS
jgi:hypothetical protein